MKNLSAFLSARLRWVGIVSSVALLAGCAQFNLRSAQQPVVPDVSFGSKPVTVNGFLIPGMLFDQAIAQRIAQGQADTPALREAVREDIINRELLAQEAVVMGLDRTEKLRVRVQQARQAAMAEIALEELVARNPVTDAEVKAEYDRQIATLGDLASLFEYRVRLITVDTEAEAKEIYVSLRKRVSFERLAKERSKDASKEQGGLLDWLLPEQMLPEVAAAVTTLKKGTNAAAPIKTPGGWNVIRLEDVRNYAPPTLKEVSDRIRRGIAQQKRTEILRKLRQTAKIATPTPAQAAAATLSPQAPQ